MKNKYLAIALSIIAVIVVAYRIFFSSDKKAAPTPSSMIHNQAEIDPDVSQSGFTQEDRNISIEIDPLQLLSPIDTEAKRYLKRELKYDSKAIFTEDGTTNSSAVRIPNNNSNAKEFNYILYATILDEDRRIAVINSRICQAGDILEGGATVKSIDSGEVILYLKGQPISLLINPNIRKINNLEGDKDEI